MSYSVDVYHFVVLQGHVVMNSPVQSVYQQVIEKTKGLVFRSQLLSNNIDKRAEIKKAGGHEWVSPTSQLIIITVVILFYY